MSKAFAPGDGENEEIELVKAPVLPPGVRNYITPEGAEKLEAERKTLIARRALLGESMEAADRRKAIDRRLEGLTSHLNRAQIIDPAQQETGRVLFGANVVVRDAAGKELRWRIVGIDETDVDQGWVSWMSPVAHALLDKRVGDTAVFGAQRWTVLRIFY
jgi:transcription elongation factor GreB